MAIFIKNIILGSSRFYITSLNYSRSTHHRIPIVELYQQTTGNLISEDKLSRLSKRHPNIDKLSEDRLQCTMQILQKFNITALEACQNLHIFSMNPITMDNYGEILKECGFITISAKHIIKYHSIAKNKSIASLKKAGLIHVDFELENALLNCLQKWPDKEKHLMKFPEASTPLLTIRTSVLERYLKWRLSISSEEFQKYCRNYLPLRHRPLADIQEALDIAENEIKFDNRGIRRNGFIISSDPVNTRLILNNVPTLAGLDIREAVRIEPAILKNNYNALLQIRDLLESYRVPNEAQANSLKVYCMRPETVQKRLEQLKHLKEFNILSSNPRVLSMVVHHKKLMARLNKIHTAKKQCYSLNHLVASNGIFDNYLNNFGSKVCSRDIATLVTSSLNMKDSKDKCKKEIIRQLKKHKFWLHVALDVIDENIRLLRAKFDDKVIYENCQLLLYPVSEVNHYTEVLLKIHRGEGNKMELSEQIDVNYNNLNHVKLTDNQILSLALYEIEKKYHFSGDGIWSQMERETDAQIN